MSANQFAAQIARNHSYRYHDVRIAVNRLINLGDWTSDQAHGYIEEVASRQGDLDAAVLEALDSDDDWAEAGRARGNGAG